MRLRLVNLTRLSMAATATTALLATAASGAEPAKSTICFVTSAPPAATPEAPPTRIVLPSQPVEPRLVPQDQPPQPAPIQAAPAAPPTAEPYPVQQAIHTAPPSPTAQMIATMSAAKAQTQSRPIGHIPTPVNVYSNPNAQATLSRMPRRMAVQPQPKAAKTPARGKPFQAVQSEPAVSPYLNMYRRDVDGGNLPNYFAFVLPQLEQQQMSRQQTAELQQLRGQLQNLGAAGGPSNSANMTAHARYMDTAQYYSGMKR